MFQDELGWLELAGSISVITFCALHNSLFSRMACSLLLALCFNMEKTEHSRTVWRRISDTFLQRVEWVHKVLRFIWNKQIFYVTIKADLSLILLEWDINRQHILTLWRKPFISGKQDLVSTVSLHNLLEYSTLVTNAFTCLPYRLL